MNLNNNLGQNYVTFKSASASTFESANSVGACSVVTAVITAFSALVDVLENNF